YIVPNHLRQVARTGHFSHRLSTDYQQRNEKHPKAHQIKKLTPVKKFTKKILLHFNSRNQL
ncbi:MAG: hypothetical protein RR061_08005, partial [Muribaculaceae bacterium]